MAEPLPAGQMRVPRPRSSRIARRDAEANRRAIVATARSRFAADGFDVPARTLSAGAGVGVATLYRHFPSRHELVSAVLSDHVDRCGRAMDAALSRPDPRDGLRTAMVHFGLSNAMDRRLTAALLRDPATAPMRRAHGDAFARLVDHARSAGVVHRSVTVDDARIALHALTAFGAAPKAQVRPVLERLTDVLIAGLGHARP